LTGVRCTDRSRRARRRRARRRRRRRILISLIVIFVALCGVGGYFLVSHFHTEEDLVAAYEQEYYNQAYFRSDLYATDLCVVDPDASDAGPVDTGTLTSAALFDVDKAQADAAYHVFDQVYPASTTKIMTALLAIENSSMDDEVTIGVHADSTQSFSYDEATIGLKEGDTIRMEDLLYGLLLYSGNDAAVAIAEHVAGDMDSFAQMMNEKAEDLMATQTHFVNAHGLHDESHYTTAYDLYLIFNECIKQDEFVKIISTDKYTAEVKGEDGEVRRIELEPSNLYATGEADKPTGATVIGGKTGTTSQAGNCLILLDENDSGEPYISVIMGADTKELLYENMTALVDEISE